ncbi:hypothetical protein ACKGJO_07045 [Gracilimonas sp. Q87]|uniref:hypothetical protein n=1 Tax=Gracilimonas sp. Q87 TaxID=3384766 RepID=UPI00398451ED
MNKHKTLFGTIAKLALITFTLLLVPLVAMQFSDDVVWTASDFIFAGTLIFATGLTYVIITRRSTSTIYRIAIGFALFSGLFLIWSNLAVGIIGSENNEFNLLYFLVIAVGIIGAFIARFKPTGLMYTMFGMAVAQTMITIAALKAGMSNLPDSSVYEILAVNGFFFTLFVIAGILFQYSVRD